MRLQGLEIMRKRQILLKTSLNRLIPFTIGLRLKEITRRRMFLVSTQLPAKDALVGRYRRGRNVVSSQDTPFPSPGCSETPSKLPRLPLKSCTSFSASAQKSRRKRRAATAPLPSSAPLPGRASEQPRARRCRPGLTPSSGGHWGAVAPSNNPRSPAPTFTRTRRDSELRLGITPKVRRRGAPRDSQSRPYQHPAKPRCGERRVPPPSGGAATGREQLRTQSVRYRHGRAH